MKKVITTCLKAIYKFFRGIYRVLPIPKHVKKRIKDIVAGFLDKSYVSLVPGYIRKTNFFVATHADKDKLLDTYEEFIDGVFKIGQKSDEFVEYREHNITFTDEDVKPIAFYLPQFYPFYENDEWWGKGFTEWTNVTKAVPHFIGHYQPRLPYDSTFYDQSNVDTIRKQTKLARNYGVYGFCFYYYWFGGKRLLEKPPDLLLDSDIDFPFCICWANENWSRRWDGSENEILIAQKYSDEDNLACIADICKYVRDERYIRINGKPLIIIYYAEMLPDISKTIKIWRNYCREQGIGEIHLAATNIYGFRLGDHDFDEIVAFPPNDIQTTKDETIIPINPKFNGLVYPMDDYIRDKRYQHDYVPYYGVFPGWDNTARRGANFSLFQMDTMLYKKWLTDVMLFTVKNRQPGNRFCFINAWNEWAEGAYLEPDRKTGYASLQATADALSNLRRKDNRKIIYVSHNTAPNGAQICSLNIIKRLTEVFGYNVYVIVKSGGELLGEFISAAYELICIEDMELNELKSWIKYTEATKAICNTVITGDVPEVLVSCGVECISAIHEMEGIIRKYSCENNLQSIVQNAKHIIFASNYVKQSVSNVAPIPDDKAIILPQGIYTHNPYLKNREQLRTEIRLQHQLPLDSKIVLGVGFGDYRKGLDLFAKCANLTSSELKNVVYMWVGHIDHMMPRLLEEQIEMSPPNVKILQVPFQNDIMRYYAAADLYLLTSREDPFPTVVLEAMEAYLPVVAFENGGGYVEVITEDTGKLVAMEDAKAMSACVSELLLDDGERSTLGTFAHNMVLERFDFNFYVRSLLALLNEEDIDGNI